MGDEKTIKSVYSPGKISEYVFSAILVLVLVASLFSFPFGALFSGTDTDSITFKVGYPMTFFELSFGETSKIPIRFLGLIVDLTLYLIIAYLIDLLFSFIFRSMKKPDLAKDQQTIIEKGKIAYEYYKKQNLTEEQIIKMFKEKGWTDENLKKIKTVTEENKINPITNQTNDAKQPEQKI